MKRFLRLIPWETRERALDTLAGLTRPGRGFHYRYDPATVARDAKHTDPSKVIDRLLRYERCIRDEVDFRGKRVLEIGAGPLLGWGLVALARGAKQATIVEPDWDPAVLQHLRGYFREHRRYLERVHGPTPTVDEALRDGRLRVLTAKASTLPLEDEEIDVVLSNSVLEHVHDLPDAAKELRRVTAPGGKHYHFVDLKDHYGGSDPFQRLYPYAPDELRHLYRHRGLRQNFLRAPDHERIFREHFNEVRRVDLLADSDRASVRNASQYWREKYPPAELGVEVLALICTR